MKRLIFGLASLAILVLSPAPSASPLAPQTFGPDFAADYSFTDLGSPSGVPGPLGGVNFKAGDTNTLLIGGNANGASGEIFEIAVTRDANNHITAFSGAASSFALAPRIDGGLAFGPAGVLFFTTFSDNRLGQIKPGSTAPDKWIDLTALGIASSVGTCTFVPGGFSGAGRFKIASFNGDDWYDMTVAADGTGTYDLVSPTQVATGINGPEGIVYIQAGNPGFLVDSVLISEFSNNEVGAYEIDGNGDPIVASRRIFLTGLSGAEGAVIDPATGDFIFSTFGGGDRVLVVMGFSAPSTFCTAKVNSQGCTPSIAFTGDPTVAGPDDFNVSVPQFVNQSWGTLWWSLLPDSAPFAGGTLCVQSPTITFPLQNTAGTALPAIDCSGAMTFHVSQAFMTANGWTPGTTAFVQFVSRDRGFTAPGNIGLSDGLRFTVQ